MDVAFPLSFSMSWAIGYRFQESTHSTSEVPTEFCKITSVDPLGAVIVELRQHVAADPGSSSYIDQPNSFLTHQLRKACGLVGGSAVRGAIRDRRRDLGR
jgi:hypothetical protein